VQNRTLDNTCVLSSLGFWGWVSFLETTPCSAKGGVGTGNTPAGLRLQLSEDLVFPPLGGHLDSHCRGVAKHHPILDRLGRGPGRAGCNPPTSIWGRWKSADWGNVFCRGFRWSKSGSCPLSGI